MQHAKASPSDYRRWSHCPGSITLQAKLINEGLIPAYEEGGEAAQEGSRLHAVAETALRGVGEPCDITKPYVDYCNAVQQATRGTLHVEAKAPLFYDEGSHGYVDCLIETEDEIHCVDLKTGSIPVPAEGNWQLLVYAMGFVTPSTKRITMTIFQGGEPDTWELTIDQAKDLASLIEDAAKLALDDQVTDLNPSEDACRFCRCKAYCSAYTKPLVDAFDNVLEAGSFERLSDAKMVEVFQKAANVRKLLKLCEDALFERCKDGAEIQGVHITTGRRGNKTWNRDVDPYEVMVTAGIPLKDAVVQKPITVTQAMKLADIDESAWYQPEGSPKLVAGESINVSEEFEILD